MSESQREIRNECDVPVDRRGYQSTKHSSEDARERTAYQMAMLKEQREEDAARAAAVRAEEAAAEAAERVMTPEEKAKEKAQKEAFYFSAGLTAGKTSTRLVRFIIRSPLRKEDA